MSAEVLDPRRLQYQASTRMRQNACWSWQPSNYPGVRSGFAVAALDLSQYGYGSTLRKTFCARKRAHWDLHPPLHSSPCASATYLSVQVARAILPRNPDSREIPEGLPLRGKSEQGLSNPSARPRRVPRKKQVRAWHNFRCDPSGARLFISLDSERYESLAEAPFSKVSELPG